MPGNDEMSFRDQIGAAGKYGAYSSRFRSRGFHSSAMTGESLVLSPETLEDRIERLSPLDVAPFVSALLHAQPVDDVLASLDRMGMLKLRAQLALRVGEARGQSEAAKELALTRTYLRPNALGLSHGSPYLDGSEGQRLSQSDRRRLYDSISEEIERRLELAAPQVGDRAYSTDHLTTRPSDDFVVERATELHTLPASTAEAYQITRSVTVRALRDDVTEYRFTIRLFSDGLGTPSLKLLAGKDAKIDRLYSTSRRGMPGYEYQVVIPFARPMMAADPPRSFTWLTLGEVDRDFVVSRKPQTFGWHPSRTVREARTAIQFAAGTAPNFVAVNRDVTEKDRNRFDPSGETAEVIDDFVEVTFTDLQIARWSNIVWHR